MLSQEIEERLAERLVSRIEETNIYILNKIGEKLKFISTLTPSQAYQLQQMLKYGAGYKEIANELAKASGKNVQEIYKIFEEVAKQDKLFAKQFYRYRKIDFIPYENDKALQEQVKALAEITAMEYINFSNTTTVGYIFKDVYGNKYFKNIQQTYQECIDRAILSVSQGKQDFNSAMRKTLKDLGGSGLVVYDSGHTRRMDSAVRMNLLGGLRDLNNTLTLRFGEEYGADGVEISVHENPAPDHADIQGRQFSLEEYNKLETGEIAEDKDGTEYDGADKRAIGEYNCYHKVFNIILGVSKPEYSEEELKEMQERNISGFDFEGKHYTMYQGTQLQRRLETAVRKQKDTQILARSAGDKELSQECEIKIRQITEKYNDLCNISGLLPKKARMSVSGYRRIKV